MRQRDSILQAVMMKRLRPLALLFWTIVFAALGFKIGNPFLWLIPFFVWSTFKKVALIEKICLVGVAAAFAVLWDEPIVFLLFLLMLTCPKVATPSQKPYHAWADFIVFTALWGVGIFIATQTLLWRECGECIVFYPIIAWFFMRDGGRPHGKRLLVF